MEIVEPKIKIQLQHLILQRVDLIKKLTSREIDESYFRRENISKNHTKDSETQLVSASNDIKALEKVIGIIEEKINKLVKEVHD